MGRDKRSFTTTNKNYTQSSDFNLTHYGLTNLGNSCYFNSSIQSLSVTRPLIELIEHPPITSPTLLSLNSTTTTDLIESAVTSSPIPLSTSFVSLISRLKTTQSLNGKKTLNPAELLRVLSQKHEEYTGGTQEDSHELLRNLLDGISMEEVDLIKKLTLKPLPVLPLKRRRMTIMPAKPTLLLTTPTTITTVEGVDGDDEDSEEEEGEEEEEDSESEKESSDSEAETEDESSQVSRLEDEKVKLRPFVETVFGGKLESFLVCSTCQHVSLSSEDFMDVSLSLKEDPTSKLRKRDRIRKTLQSGFFSKKADVASSKPTLPPLATPSSPPPMIPLRNIISLSETEGSASASASEVESADEDRPMTGSSSGLSRRKSLDPANHLSRSGSRSFWSSSPSTATSMSASNHSTSSSHLNPTSSTSISRDTSPIGRALSRTFSTSKSLSRSSKSRSSSNKPPKIPKPSREQMNYVKKIMKEIPASGGIPLSAQLRWSLPDKSGASSGSSSHSHGGEKMVGSGGGREEQAGTDLYDCLVSFTSVEVLEGNNKFACHNCWKLLNPELVLKRREEKQLKKNEKLARRASRSSRRSVISTSVIGEEREPDILPVSPAVLRFAPDLPIGIIIPNTNMRSLEAGLDSIDLLSATTPKSSYFNSSSAISINSTSFTTDAEDEEEEDSGNVTDTSTTSRSQVHIIPPTPTTAPLTTANVNSLPSSTQSRSQEPLTTTLKSLPTTSSLHSLTTSTSSSLSPNPNHNHLPSKSNISFSSSKVAPPSSIVPPKASRHILREARKRYLFSPTSLPPVLVIQFKRFQQTSKSGFFGTAFTNLKKRDDILSFSTRLDLTPFLAPTEKGPQDKRGRKRDGTGREGEGKVEAIYELYSVVVHSGSLKEGHYISYVLSDMFTEKLKRGLTTEKEEVEAAEGIEAGGGEGQEKSSTSTTPKTRTWIYCSDHEVRQSSVEEVLKSKAYILFYEKVHSSSNYENGSNSKGLVKSHI